MKNITTTIGLFAAALIIISFLFRIMHLPGIWPLLAIAFILISFGYLPCFFYAKYKDSKGHKNWILWLTGFIAMFCISLSFLVSIMNWPFRSFLTLVGFTFLYLIFIPIYLYHTRKFATDKFTNYAVLIGLVFGSTIFSFSAFNLVNKEILNSFTVIDEGIIESKVKLDERVNTLYEKLEGAENNTAIREIASQLKSKTDKLVDFIEKIKTRMYSEAGSEDGTLEKVADKSNVNIPSQIMILEMAGNELKQNLSQYRDWMLDVVSDNNISQEIKISISSLLNTTDPPPNPSVGQIPWEAHYFDHLPLMAVSIQLSSIQSNVKRVEFDVLSFLIRQESNKARITSKEE